MSKNNILMIGGFLVIALLVGTGTYWFLSKDSALKKATTISEEKKEKADLIQTQQPESQIPTETKPEEKEKADLNTNSSSEDKVNVNFSQTGTLLNREGEWIFLWDEPGALALNVKLLFNQSSSCSLLSGKNGCQNLDQAPEGATVKIEGEKQGDQVTIVKLEEIQF